jgi:DNA-binding response OmpR family regulator
MLPGMSGWQFLERSHAHLEQANIPVVIVSAISGRGDYPAALGVAAWLTKPVDIDQFLGAVEAMVGPSRAIQGRAAVAERPDARRVLVIEDEQSIRDLIVEHLAGEGFLSSGVATVADAQAAIAEQRPSLVVLDLMLPGTSGFALLEQRRDNPMLQEIPVLVLSAAPPDKLLQAKKSGADAFLSKPFDFDALTALVRSYVH